MGRIAGGSELILCKNLKRNYISCEIHPEYYQMILDRLNNGGQIKDEYRLQFVQDKYKNCALSIDTNDLFSSIKNDIL
jgi:DNA modification methylase